MGILCNGVWGEEEKSTRVENKIVRKIPVVTLVSLQVISKMYSMPLYE